MRSILLCLLGVVVVFAGTDHHAEADDFDTADFPSKFLSRPNTVELLLRVMTLHFDTSLDYMFDSKYYGSHYVERPGMSKLLAEESDRQWEEGMNVLKKYLHIGGLNNDAFQSNMNFKVKNNLFSKRVSLQEIYKQSLKKVTKNSRKLVNRMTSLCHAATRTNTSDADVAHFFEEKAEKEADVARKMIEHYVILQSMSSIGMALDVLDKNL